MHIHPMLAALRKHKAGVVLISLQIALTLAIVCNATFIIGQRIERVNRPTGLEENNLLLVTQQWVGAPGDDVDGSTEVLDSMLREDIAALRALPGVESVTTVNSLPLLNSAWNGGVSATPTEKWSEITRSTYYFSDDNALDTLGARLIAGRNFTPDEVINASFRDQPHLPVTIISKALADKLYPAGDAVGKVMYVNGGSDPTTIVGVVERLQAPSLGSWATNFTWQSALFPVRLNSSFSRYAVRTVPGRQDEVAKAIAPTLYQVNPMRVLDDSLAVRSFENIRHKAYRADVGMASLMALICLILLAVTAAGVVGLTSFWVGQRHRQIGVRRALGATRGQIQRYFQLENFLIASIGVVLGLIFAFALNQWLMSKYELSRLPLMYLPMGAVTLWLLGQIAVLGPARRAAMVPPAIATRSA